MAKFTKQTAAQMGRKGGKNTHKIYGKSYMVMLGKRGAKIKKARKLSTASGLTEKASESKIS